MHGTKCEQISYSSSNPRKRCVNSGSSNWMRLPDFGTDQIPINVPKSYHEANQPMNPGGKLTQTSGEVQGRQMFDRPTWGCINLTYPIFVYGFYGERKKLTIIPRSSIIFPDIIIISICVCVCVNRYCIVSSSSSSPPPPPLSPSPWCLL